MKILLAILVLSLFSGINGFFDVSNNPYRKTRPPQQRYANKVLLPVFEVCGTEYDAPADDFQKARNRDTSDESRAFECTITCFFERIGLINKNGRLSRKYTKYFFEQSYGENPEKVDTAIEACRKIKAKSCRGRFNLYSCFAENDL